MILGSKDVIDLLKICLCDDNSMHLEYITSTIQNELNSRGINYSLQEFNSLKVLQTMLDKKEFIFDLVLLDIDFNGETSIPLAKKINEVSPGSYIIYISNYLDYVKEVFDTNFLYYIVKDELEEKFPKALDKTLAYLETNPKLTIQKKNKIYILNQHEIMYLERDLRVTHIVCKDSKITIPDRLEDLIEKLDSHHFIRCHRSYIINTQYLQEYSHSSVVMRDNYSIPVSRRYQSDIKKFLINYNNE